MKALMIGIICIQLSLSIVAQKIPQKNVSASPFTVCQILQDLAHFRGTTVRVRGEWTGSQLKVGCSPLALKSGNYEWPHALSLESPQSLAVQMEEPADWSGIDSSVYWLAFAGAKAQISTLVPEATRSRAKVIATITGRLDVRFDRNQPEVLAFEKGSPIGYGDNGWLPARLVIANLEDVSVTVDGTTLQDWELRGGIPQR